MAAPHLNTVPVDSGNETSSIWTNLRDVPAWLISFGLHLVVLLLLGTMTRIVIMEPPATIVSTIDTLDDQQLKFDATVMDTVGSDSAINSLTASQEAATALGQDPQEQIKQVIDENFTVELPMNDQVPEIAKSEFLESVETRGATEHPGGVEGAVDRLAFEIAGSLRERKTLVVWLFDVSPSLAKRRQAIAERFENVYRQLGMLEVDSERALKTAVMTVGDKTDVLTPDPVDDLAQLVKVVKGIKSVSSGTENLFSAVNQACTRFLAYRTKMKRNVMVVLVTDEAGSDPENLEQAVTLAKRYGIRCYVVGNAAPFGRRHIETPFTLENGEEVIGVMERGPESFYPERINLAFWGTNGSGLDELSSGFGPYGLTRLCAETNGLYLIAADTGGVTFDPVAMRDYQPDYRPITVYDADIKKNMAKRALIEVAEKTKVESVPRPQLTFLAYSDNVLRQGITEAQRPAAILDYKLEEMMRILQQGEQDRAKVTESRWRAGYDVAIGRVLAMRVRTYGYNAVLAEMKASPKRFETEGNNVWRLTPSREITAGASVKKLAKQATDYLTRVVDEHPGTPWALLAERELSEPLGWEWKESKRDIPGMKPGATEEEIRLLLADEEEKRAKSRGNAPPAPKRRDI